MAEVQVYLLVMVVLVEMVPSVVVAMVVKVLLDLKMPVAAVEVVVLAEDLQLALVELVDHLGRVQVVVEMVQVINVALVEPVLEVMVPQFVKHKV